MSMSDEKNAPLSIVMLASTLPPLKAGGAELKIVKLSEKLVLEGFDVTVVTRGIMGAKNSGWVNGVRIEKVFVLSHYLRNLNLSANKATETIKKGAKKKIPDVKSLSSVEKTFAHTLKLHNIIFGAFFGICALGRIRSKKIACNIIYATSLDWIGIIGAFLGKALGCKVVLSDSTMNGIVRMGHTRMGAFFQRFIVRNCYFVAISSAIAENYVKVGVPAERIFRIPNGVEMPEKAARKDYFGRECLFVGNLRQQPAKGLDVLLEAWKAIADKYPAARLSVVGEGDIESYNKYVAALGIGDRVSFVGRVDRSGVSRYMERSDVFILPSRREGMSNALLEAMSYAMPVVATDISGSQDLIINGSNGILVPVEDADALSAAIELLFENPDKARAMGEEARNTVRNKYDVNIVAKQYASLFTRLAGPA